jgi:hypothetical protein
MMAQIHFIFLLGYIFVSAYVGKLNACSCVKNIHEFHAAAKFQSDIDIFL